MAAIEPRTDGPLTAGDVADALKGPGLYWHTGDVTLDQFRAVCEQLGEVFYEADVRLGAERPRNYQLPQPIDFHTDHVSAEIAAWYCLEREQDGGCMRFLDLAPVADEMSAEELDALARVRVPDNAVWSQSGDIPLCTPNGARPAFHYVPWLKLKAPDGQARAALGRFEALVRTQKETALIDADLAPGHIVIIDNHR
ncbi:MAG: hypothetical protein ACR2PM_09595, partial [Hyphomicrobiales bacterium]